MVERLLHSTTSSSCHLDFGKPSIIERAILPTQVQPPCASASNQADLMDITEDMEQVTAQNPLPLESEVRATSIQAIQLICHLTATIEWSDALNKRNQNELNLLQQKVKEKDQIIVQKDAIIVETDGTINSHLSTIATLIAQISKFHLTRSQQQTNEAQSRRHSEEALNTLIVDLSHAIVDPVITPLQPPSRQFTLSLHNYPGGLSRPSTIDSQDSLSFPSSIYGIPTT